MPRKKGGMDVDHPQGSRLQEPTGKPASIGGGDHHLRSNALQFCANFSQFLRLMELNTDLSAAGHRAGSAPPLPAGLSGLETPSMVMSSAVKLVQGGTAKDDVPRKTTLNRLSPASSLSFS